MTRNHYYNGTYDSKERFSSYWHQIDEILSLNAEQVLEIGIGNGLVSSYLNLRKKKIITLDIDKDLNPDVVGSVVDIPFADESFDIVACYEVLEHLPFSYFPAVLIELKRISKAYVILSLPDKTGRAYRFNVHIPKIGEVKSLITIPRLRPIKWEFNGVHYWEVGTRGCSVKKITSHLRKFGFHVRKSYRVFEYPYHRFFVLEKDLHNKNI